MGTILVAALAGWLTMFSPPPQEATAKPTAKKARLSQEAKIERGEELSTEGWTLFQQQQFGAALKKFEEAVALDPEAANSWSGLGWSRFNSGESQPAIEAFEKAVALEPDHPGALNGLGQTYLSLRNYDLAEKFLVKAAPKAPAAWFGLARLYALTGELDKAATWAKKAQAEQPDDATLKEIVAAAKEGKLSDSLRQQIEPPKIGKEPAAKLAGEGWRLMNQGKARSAERSFRLALAKDPDNLPAMNGLGFLLLNLGKTADAKVLFEKYLAKQPDAAGPMNGLARCLKDEGKIDEAIALWKKMSEKYPAPNAGTVGLAMAFLEKKEYAKAIPYFEELVKSQPENLEFKAGLEAARKGSGAAAEADDSSPADDVAALNAQGWQQFFGGKYSAAEKTFRQILESQPDHPGAMNGLAFCLLNQGNAEEAKPYFEKLLKISPDLAGPMNGMARCLRAEGKVDEAVALWEKLCKQNPGPNDGMVYLAQIYSERKEYAKALPYYEELVKWQPKNKEFRRGFEAAKEAVTKK